MPLTLMTAAEHAELNTHVNEAAEAAYPGVTFDTALPHSWCVRCEQGGFDPRGHVVWGYPPEYRFMGVPLPITAEGALGLARLTMQLPPRP